MLTTLERESRPVAGWTWEKVNTKSGEKQEGLQKSKKYGIGK